MHNTVYTIDTVQYLGRFYHNMNYRIGTLALVPVNNDHHACILILMNLYPKIFLRFSQDIICLLDLPNHTGSSQ